MFDVVVANTAVEAEVSTAGTALSARWLNPPADQDTSAASLPVTFRLDGQAHGSFTRPTRRGDQWVEDPIDAATLRYLAGGVVADWLARADWISRDDAQISSSCPTHAPNCCVRFDVQRPGVTLAALIATRVRPALSGIALGAPMPWEVPATGGVRTGRVHASGEGEGTLADEFELWDRLVDAVEDATRKTRACVEFGIVEHHFAVANVDDYRFLYERFGHIAVDGPREYTLSGYLGQLLGHLSRRDQVVHIAGRGTGYWDYNTDISCWGLPGADRGTTVSWRDFAVDNGWHPMSWPAASLLWGDEPVLERSWSGHVGPGEEPPGVTADTLPIDADDPDIATFAQSFDVAAAFGADAGPVADRVLRNWGDDLGLPRDLGMLRAALAGADMDDANYIGDLLGRMRQLV